MSFTYNNARLRSGLTLQQPTGTWTNGFTYDAAHRLATVSSPGGTFTYTYKAACNLVTNLALPNSAKITNAYDNVARLTGTCLVNSGGAVLNKHLYLYNTRGQRIRHTRTDDSYLTNTYDNIGQLQSVGAYTSGGSPISIETKGYLYDAAWNLNQRTNNSSGSTTTFNVNTKNELTSVGGNSYSYDSNGNLTNPSFLVYDYDAENQLKTVTYVNTSKTDFVYDGRGRLRKRIDYTWNSTMGSWQTAAETRYVYDGMRVIQERDSGNTPTVSYTRGSDLIGSFERAGGIGGLLTRSHGYSGGSWSTHNYYHADGGGNITMLTDASQVTVASYRYDCYGNMISSSGALAGANMYRFSSKEWNNNWSLYFYGYRFYNPDFQRWLNRDSIGERGGINLYSYAANDPMNLIDPLGLWQFTIGGGWGLGGAISFGYNSGRFNLQFNGGWAAGANVDFNPHDSGASKMQALAIKVGVKTSAEVKAGPFVRGEAEVNEFFEADMCNNWHVKGAFKGVAGGRVPFTDFKVHAGGAVGPEIGGQGWHIDEAHFYAENEGASIGLGGMVFGGAIIGFSW